MNDGLSDQQFHLLKMVHLVCPVVPMELLFCPLSVGPGLDGTLRGLPRDPPVKNLVQARETSNL